MTMAMAGMLNNAGGVNLHSESVGDYRSFLRHAETASVNTPNRVILTLPQRFAKLREEWKRSTPWGAGIRESCALPAYQKIVNMGHDVVPTLLRELKRQPDHWFIALKAITGQDPVQPENRGKVRLMAADWVKWGEARGLV